MRSWFTRLCLGAIACILAVAVGKYQPLVFHGDDTGEVYRRYAQRDDLKVGFVKDYRINDTLTVDVTTITATDSASWEALLREMNKSESMIKRIREIVEKGSYSLSAYYCEIGHPENRIPFDENGCSLVITNPAEKTIYIFHVENHNQVLSIIRNKIREIKLKA